MRITWILPVLLVFAPIHAAKAQSLEKFRAPTDIESAYVGVAAALKDPELCSRISPAALNRVRKPVLTRSLCYYHVALATQSPDYCSEAAPVPSETGMMAWLDPERCAHQVDVLSKVQRARTPPTNLDAFFTALGYSEGDAEPHGWLGFLDATIADPSALEELKNRLKTAPDFSDEKAATIGYSPEEAAHEKGWVLQRALTLCFAGRSDTSCDADAISLARTQGLQKYGLAPPDPPSSFRQLTEMEKAFLNYADSLRDPALCNAIGEDVIIIGWSKDSGYGFLNARSGCLIRVASVSNNANYCRGVRPISDTSLDGARATAEQCRKAVLGGESTLPPPNESPDWSETLKALGYGSDLSHGDQAAWTALSARLANPLSKEHQAFKRKLELAAKTYKVSDAQKASLTYSKSDLQLRAYQFSATRFHCNLNWSDVSEQSSNGSKNYWTPDKPVFTLTNQNGAEVTEKDFQGRYMLAYFGFTYCPDVCPTSLHTITTALDQLGADRSRIVPVFVTLDHIRDTPEEMADYVANFGDDFVGLTGTEADIARAARSFNVYYFAGEVDGTYTVEHTSYYYLVSPEGKTIKYFDYGTSPDAMAEELRAILAGQAPSPGGNVSESRMHKKAAAKEHRPITFSSGEARRILVYVVLAALVLIGLLIGLWRIRHK